MSETIKLSGRCLCGDVTVTANTVVPAVGVCHCGMCRKWGGGPLMTADGQTDVTIEGKDSLTTYPSSEWGERAFCSRCGSHLFYRVQQTGQYFLSVGLFTIPDNMDMEHQIFIDEKPHFYSFSNQTHTMTAAETMAAFMQESSN
ncbi:GFA family protein [Aestuariibacter sp. AA17]|uniref:GFA family protein n=1 Tax=Fluctibacter corallii TaxID=2984329 RepID=A0ABT3AAL5_9ALTE|nr:GFA family protein [Aestuariibacter sp. AA17]MCV2885713.1 GFA family protein [Aestuariibacter sp. AA17]